GAAAPIYVVGSSLVVVGDDWYELGPTLDVVAKRPGMHLSTIAANASGSYVYVDGGSVAARPGTAFFFKAGPHAHGSTIAWGHVVWARLGDGRWGGDGYLNVR